MEHCQSMPQKGQLYVGELSTETRHEIPIINSTWMKATLMSIDTECKDLKEITLFQLTLGSTDGLLHTTYFYIPFRRQYFQGPPRECVPDFAADFCLSHLALDL